MRGIDADSIPRYAEPTWDELNKADNQPACRSCIYYKDVEVSQNGLTEYIGVCVFEAFQANTWDELAKAELVLADPTDEPCRDYKEDK